MEFKILGKVVEADLFEADILEQFEDTVAKTVGKIQEKPENERGSEGIRRQCKAVIECIDTIFGEGAAHKVFGDKTNLMDSLDAFKDVCFIHEQMSAKIQEKAKSFNKQIIAATKRRK